MDIKTVVVSIDDDDESVNGETIPMEETKQDAKDVMSGLFEEQNRRKRKVAVPVTLASCPKQPLVENKVSIYTQTQLNIEKTRTYGEEEIGDRSDETYVNEQVTTISSIQAIIGPSSSVFSTSRYSLLFYSNRLEIQVLKKYVGKEALEEFTIFYADLKQIYYAPNGEEQRLFIRTVRNSSTVPFAKYCDKHYSAESQECT